MKNRWKHIFIPVLAMALCLSLAACGNSDDVAGEDWRTTGVVVGSGTITHDSESVDVLVTVGPNSAAFYRDQEEQVLFDSVAFPETIEDISSSAFQISFDDQNGDGESDVLVEIGHEDMSNTTMLWLWDPQERYVYQPDYSSFHVPGVAGPEELIAPYVGLWELDDPIRRQRRHLAAGQHFPRSLPHGHRHCGPLSQPIFQPLLLRRDSYEKETQ